VNGLDYFFLAVIAVSAIWALMRGLVRELVALAGWLLAIVLSATFSAPLESILRPWINVPWAARYGASLLIFVGVLLVFAFLGRWLGTWLAKRGFSLWDRMAGLMFGMLRGGLILLVVIVVHSAMGAPVSRWTEDSWLYSHGRDGMMRLVNYFPEDSAMGAGMRRVGLNHLK